MEWIIPVMEDDLLVNLYTHVEANVVCRLRVLLDGHNSRFRLAALHRLAITMSHLRSSSVEPLSAECFHKSCWTIYFGHVALVLLF